MTRRAAALLCLALLLASAPGCRAPGSASGAPAEPQLVPRWVPVFERALGLAAEDRAAVDRSAARARLDEVAARLREALDARLPKEAAKERPALEAAAEVVAGVLFGELRFSGDPGDPGALSRDLLDIDRVLETRRGTCLAIVLVGLAAAERAGMETAPVLTPGHAMLAVPPGFLVDPATGGVRLPSAGSTPSGPEALLAELLANRASYRRQAGDLDGALRDAEEALRLSPESLTARVNRGVLLLDRGETERAQRELMDLEREGKGTAVSAFNLAIAAGRAGALGEAKHWYRAATERDPSFFAAWVNRGALHEALDEPVAARLAYQRALALSPDSAEVKARLEHLGAP